MWYNPGLQATKGVGMVSGWMLRAGDLLTLMFAPRSPLRLKPDRYTENHLVP